MDNSPIKKTILLGSLCLFIQTFSHADQMISGQDMDSHVSAYGSELGSVNLSVSCNKRASKHFNTGLALLHHMTYEDARTAFANASKVDSNCAMAYWGQAMTLIHPLWSDPPSEAEFKQGQSWLKQAKTVGHKTKQEHAYIASLDAYFNVGKQMNEKSNLAAFEKKWAEVYKQFPDDLEAASFYALAQLATVNPADKGYSKQKKAGALAEKVLFNAPNHPGAHHYVIHAYDYPALSKEALRVARSYGKIAPEIPHSLHMPTHIFTRLGQWDDSIEMNKRSAAAALKHPAGDAISLHYPHALDYLAYAYLQQADDQQAKQVLETLMNADNQYQTHVATAYTLAAVPARIALERQQWKETMALKPRAPESFPWQQFPAMEAITHFARALGAARSGNEDESSKAIEALAALQKQTAQTSPYWAKQVEIQRLSAIAWLKYHQGSKKDALEVMREAAELEKSTEKHPVTPGEILPASELLAEMLLEQGEYQQAQISYEKALQRSANRLNSLYGAGRSAELNGDKVKARHYYQRMVNMTKSDSKWERLEHARKFLAQN